LKDSLSSTELLSYGSIWMLCLPKALSISSNLLFYISAIVLTLAAMSATCYLISSSRAILTSSLQKSSCLKHSSHLAWALWAASWMSWLKELRMVETTWRIYWQLAYWISIFFSWSCIFSWTSLNYAFANPPSRSAIWAWTSYCCISCLEIKSKCGSRFVGTWGRWDRLEEYEFVILWNVKLSSFAFLAPWEL